MTKVLEKLENDQITRAFLIYPMWTTQIWFSKLLESLIDFPLKLPFQKDQLTLNHNNCYRTMNKGKLFLIEGCCVSGDLQKKGVLKEALNITNSWRLFNEVNIVIYLPTL